MFHNIWYQKLGQAYVLNIAIDEGMGQPIVFLHGLAGSGQGWRSALTQINQDAYRLITLDLLGFGDSPKPVFKDYSVDDHAKSVIKTLKKMRLKRPIILVGHSMGTLISTRVAAKEPQLVKHLILYEIPVYADFPAQHLSDIRHKAYISLFNQLIKNPRRTLRLSYYLGRVASNFMNVSLTPESWVPFERSLLHTVMRDSIYKDLKTLTIPVDVIYGKYDFIVIKRIMKKLFKTSPQIRFHEVNETHRIGARAGRMINNLLQQKHI